MITRVENPVEDLKSCRESQQVEQGPMSAECSEKSIPKSPAWKTGLTTLILLFPTICNTGEGELSEWNPSLLRNIIRNTLWAFSVGLFCWSYAFKIQDYTVGHHRCQQRFDISATGINQTGLVNLHMTFSGAKLKWSFCL